MNRTLQDVNQEASQSENQAPPFQTEDQLDEQSTFDGRIWLKTITAKAIELHPERAKLHNRPVVCGRIAGEVRGVVDVPSDPTNPNSEKLTLLVGEFVADSYTDDGEVFGFRGEWCGLPIAHNIMLARLQKMIDAGTDAPIISFDLEIAALPAGNPAGYRWGARSMVPTTIEAGGFLSDQTMKNRRNTAKNASLPEFNRRAIEHVVTGTR